MCFFNLGIFNCLDTGKDSEWHIHRLRIFLEMNNRGRKVKKKLRGFSGKIFGYTAHGPSTG